MMSNKIKRMLAVVLAMVMVFGMSITSYAVTGTTTGSDTGTGDGAFEGSVDKDVISVTLPTTDTTTFDFILDPEGLIAATANEKYPNATFEEGVNVFFKSSDNTYTDESAKLKVINKGTVDVDITVKASVDNTNAIDYDAATMDGKKLSEVAGTVGKKVIMATAGDEQSVSKNDLPILYLGLQAGGQAAEAVRTSDDTTTPAEVAVGVQGNEDNYSVSYNSVSQKYEFSINGTPAETAWNSMEFNLVGKCSTFGDWSTSDLVAPTVTLTWSYAQRADASVNPLLEKNAVSESAPEFTCTTANVINFTNGTGKLALAESNAITKLEGDWGGYCDMTYDMEIDYSAKTITLSDFGTGAAVPVRITYTNANGDTCTATLSLIVPAN